jgi:predicted Zn-dependent peptidase
MSEGDSGTSVLRDDILQEEIHSSKVSGMNVFVLPKPGFKRKYSEVFVRYGSNDNAFQVPGKGLVQVPPGIAHFLEHKMFEKSWGEAFGAFARLGASANAYTANNYTSYLFWTLDNLRDALDLLFRVALEPYFTEQSVAKEQDIIGQEIRMYNDEPGSRLVREVLQALYLEHPVRIDIAGTEESIKQIDKDLLYTCHGVFYRPWNMTLFVGGDVDPNQVFDLAGRFVQDYGPEKPIERVRPVEPPFVGKDAVINLPVPIPMVQVAWKHEPSGDDGASLIRKEIAANFLLDVLFGKSSAFFTEAYEEDLLDEVSASHDSWPDYCFSAVAAQSMCPERFVERVHKEIERALGQGVSEDDFKRVKKAAIGRYVTVFDTFSTAGEIHVHLVDIGQDIFSYGRALEAVTLDDVEERLEAFKRDRSVSVIVRDESKE